MDDEELQAEPAARVREAIASLGRRGRTGRIPRPVRELVVAHARERRERDWTWEQIAEEIGLPISSVKRWTIGESEPTRRRRMRPVQVLAASSGRSRGKLAVISPGGYRLEGLGVEEAVRVLRELG